jgi:hypothetical protein
VDYPHFLRKWLADAPTCLLTDGDRTVARGAIASAVARVALEHDAADRVLGTEQLG